MPQDILLLILETTNKHDVDLSTEVEIHRNIFIFLMFIFTRFIKSLMF